MDHRSPTRIFFNKCLSSVIAVTFLFSNIVFADTSKINYDTDTHGALMSSALAPIMLTWAGSLDDAHIRALLSDVPFDVVPEDELQSLIADIIQRFRENRRGYAARNIEKWIIQTLRTAREREFDIETLNADVMKEAYLDKVKAGITDMKSVEKGGVSLTVAEAQAIDAFVEGLGASPEFNGLFTEIYERVRRGRSPPSTPPGGSTAIAHRMHNGWITRMLELDSTEEDPDLVEAVSKVIDPAYNNGVGDMVIVKPVSNYFADLIGVNYDDCIDQHKVHEAIEKILLEADAAATGGLAAPLILKIEERLALPGDKRTKFMESVSNLYGEHGLEDFRTMLAHAISEVIDDMLFPDIDDHLPSTSDTEYGIIQEIGDLGLKATVAIVSADPSAAPKFAEGILQGQYFTDVRGRTIVSYKLYDEFKSSMLALKICLRAHIITDIAVDLASPFPGLPSANKANFIAARQKTIISFLERGNHDSTDKGERLIQKAARLLISWDDDYGAEDLLAEFKGAIEGLSTDKKVLLILQIGAKRAKLADHIFAHTDIREIDADYYLGMIRSIMESKTAGAKLELLGQIVRLLGNLKVPYADALSLKGKLEMLYDNERGRTKIKYLNEMKKVSQYLKDAEEEVRAYLDTGADPSGEGAKDKYQAAATHENRLKELAAEGRRISLQQELDTFII